ncbi:DNA-binding transcriptional MerR regulator [Catenulispora sp. GP43]|uniref:helix-turn-helix domain-containing protein n=1 Tax=Catenulispora sp. GP43 TaxID=3156263 RepID=UPI003519010C
MNGDSAAWTIDRLARLAAAALTDASPTQPNGRIREVPDVRTIRWYTSIGLLGRPAAMRGRTALYDRSHLAQLVAIKRLQASGLTVAAVQERLLGADESAVEEIAMLPADLDALLAQVEAADEPAPASPGASSEPEARKRFWVTSPAPSAAAGSAPGSGSPVTSADTNTSTDTATSANANTSTDTATSANANTSTDVAPPVHGIRLGSGVTLLLPSGRAPEAAERAAIAEAARPLLDLLDRLGLAEA